MLARKDGLLALTLSVELTVPLTVFQNMVGVHCVRDKGNNAQPCLIGPDWLRVRI